MKHKPGHVPLQNGCSKKTLVLFCGQGAVAFLRQMVFKGKYVNYLDMCCECYASHIWKDANLLTKKRMFGNGTDLPSQPPTL